MNDIKKRWNERVISNGWDKSGAQGATMYLQKYGKNISTEKLKKLAQYAGEQGCNDFADELLNHIISWKELSFAEADRMEEMNDAIDTYNDLTADNEPCVLFEATMEELAKRKVGTTCGTVGNTCYIEIAKVFPDLKVRGCLLIKENATSSVAIKIKNKKQGERIEELADDGEGSLRFDWCEKAGWCYFETE